MNSEKEELNWAGFTSKGPKRVKDEKKDSSIIKSNSKIHLGRGNQ